MGLFSFLTGKSKETTSTPAQPAKARSEPAPSPAPPTPPPAPQGKSGKKGGQNQAHGGKQGAQQRQAGNQPSGGKQAGSQPRGQDNRSPVPPVGVRGETDLAAKGASGGKAAMPSVQGSADEVDRESIRELFSEIAASQVGPVITFISELRSGTASKEWLEICKPVMAVLVESANSLGLTEIAQPMTEFTSALDLAGDGKEGPIDTAAREILLESFDAMAKMVPQAFTRGGPAPRRETMLLHALLKQVPGVGVVTIDRLYAAGLTSLEPLFAAQSKDLAVTTGIPASLCDEICKKLREHRTEIEQTAGLPADQRFGARLRNLLHEMIRSNSEYEQYAESGGFDGGLAERKRMARKHRNLCALKIEATLVEMGEIDRADRLRVLSFEQRISVLAEFLGVDLVKRAVERR